MYQVIFRRILRYPAHLLLSGWLIVWSQGQWPDCGSRHCNSDSGRRADFRENMIGKEVADFREVADVCQVEGVCEVEDICEVDKTRKSIKNRTFTLVLQCSTADTD